MLLPRRHGWLDSVQKPPPRVAQKSGYKMKQLQGLACSMQMGRYDGNEILKKMNAATHHLSAGVPPPMNTKVGTQQ